MNFNTLESMLQCDVSYNLVPTARIKVLSQNIKCCKLNQLKEQELLQTSSDLCSSAQQS